MDNCNIGWHDEITLTVFNLDGTVKEVIALGTNKITTDWLNAVRDSLDGSVTDLKIKYMAWGSGNTAVSAGHHKLVAEFGRKLITTQADGSSGVEISTTYVAPFEGDTATIEELGWFAGAGATGSLDTGIMVGRILYHRVKTNLESIQVERTDTVSEV